jgi:hypothetical protein
VKDFDIVGEFGVELAVIIPHIKWLSDNQMLGNISIYEKMEPFYYFAKNFKVKQNKKRAPQIMSIPNGQYHLKQLNLSQYSPPPYKQIYKNNIFTYNKPILVICNKHTTEWGKPPINFIDIETLINLIEKFYNKYEIFYNNPFCHIVDDNSAYIPLNEIPIIRDKFPNVHIMQNEFTLLKDQVNSNFNMYQLMVYSNCSNFISVQGGSAVFCSYFGGKNLILAKRGDELKVNSYNNWFSKLSNCCIFVNSSYNELISCASNQF